VAATAEPAAFAFGVETNLSARSTPAGYVAAGALVADGTELTGIVTDGGAELATVPAAGLAATGVVPVAPGVVPPAGALAAARFADDGETAGVKPATATACGVDCEDGNLGVAERATTDVSSGAVSFFHQAVRGPDWQPMTAAKEATKVNDRSAVRFISMETRCF